MQRASCLSAAARHDLSEPLAVPCPDRTTLPTATTLLPPLRLALLRRPRFGSSHDLATPATVWRAVTRTLTIGSMSQTAAVAATSPPPLNEHRADLAKPEYFDLRDERGALTGRTKLRSEVHRDGDWHASVHIWLIHTKTGQILLQKRAACKDSFPSTWDVSCAGHLAAGETPESAALAELAEELGIHKPPEVEFTHFFRQLPTLAREVISQGGKFIDREHTFIYYVEGAWELSTLTLQEEEVEAVEWMELEDLLQHLTQKSPGFVPIPDIDVYSRAVFDPLAQRIQAIRAANGNASA